MRKRIFESAATHQRPPAGSGAIGPRTEGQAARSVHSETVAQEAWRAPADLSSGVSMLRGMGRGGGERQAHVMRQLQNRLGNRRIQMAMDIARQGEDGARVTPDIERSIEGARGGGQALDSSVRLQMESAMGADFSGVRVHADAGAHTLNQALGARAFTTGKDVFFGEGEYRPGSSSGRRLLAHELTHVMQQSGTGIRGKLTVGQADDQYEREADRTADQVTQMIDSGSLAQPGSALSGAPLQRSCPACSEEMKRQVVPDEEKPEELKRQALPEEKEEDRLQGGVGPQTVARTADPHRVQRDDGNPAGAPGAPAAPEGTRQNPYESINDWVGRYSLRVYDEDLVYNDRLFTASLIVVWDQIRWRGSTVWVPRTIRTNNTQSRGLSVGGKAEATFAAGSGATDPLRVRLIWTIAVSTPDKAVHQVSNLGGELSAEQKSELAAKATVPVEGVPVEGGATSGRTIGGSLNFSKTYDEKYTEGGSTVGLFFNIKSTSGGGIELASYDYSGIYNLESDSILKDIYGGWTEGDLDIVGVREDNLA